MKNPIITREGKTVYADGKPIGEYDSDALKENIVFYFNDSHNHPLMPHGWFFLNLVDTPEHAQEVAAGGEGKAPIIFFPGTLSRAPNFPTVWKKKFFHKGIVAAVQGQFRGGTKLHIEYMNVRPGYRRNKIMDILITFLEKKFEPKTKEFHQLTKDGTAFVKGTKRNPYPDDNELPDDFRGNAPDWNFKLNVKGISDDFFDPITLEVIDGFLYGHVEGDNEKNGYEIGNVSVILARKFSHLPAKRSSTGNLRGYISNVGPIVREIIEKALKQEGYKSKKNPSSHHNKVKLNYQKQMLEMLIEKIKSGEVVDLDPAEYEEQLRKINEILKKKNPINANKRQVEWAQGEGGNEGIAFYDIDPLEYLRLSAESPEHFHQLLKESKKMEFYNSDEVQKNLAVHPFLSIDEHGKIDAHEGRHRAAATYNAGENTYRIAIMAEKRSWPFDKYGRRWYRQLEVPMVLKAQYPGMDHEHRVDRSKLTPIPPYYYLEEDEGKVKKNPLPKLEFEEIE